MAKVGEVRVRWSRALPSVPSSVTIIGQPDGHYYASFVVDVAASPLPPVETEAGIDMGPTDWPLSRTPAAWTGRGRPEALGAQAAQARQVWSGRSPAAREDKKQGQGSMAS